MRCFDVAALYSRKSGNGFCGIKPNEIGAPSEKLALL
jgi:hypothetical protein